MQYPRHISHSQSCSRRGPHAPVRDTPESLHPTPVCDLWMHPGHHPQCRRPNAAARPSPGVVALPAGDPEPTARQDPHCRRTHRQRYQLRAGRGYPAVERRYAATVACRLGAESRYQDGALPRDGDRVPCPRRATLVYRTGRHLSALLRREARLHMGRRGRRCHPPGQQAEPGQHGRRHHGDGRRRSDRRCAGLWYDGTIIRRLERRAGQSLHARAGFGPRPDLAAQARPNK